MKATSLRVYHQNAKRLYRLVESDFEELPVTGKWLEKNTLMKKLKNIPVNKRRHLSLAGLKSAYAYDLNKKETAKCFAKGRS